MQSIKLLHYRNATYQGHTKSNKKNGKGLLITDKGEILVGTWKNDKLYGNGLIILSPNEHMFGQFNRGQLQGWSKFQSNQKILISQFNSSRLINKQLLISKTQLSYKITTPTRNAIYQTVKQHTLPQGFQRNQNLIQELSSKQLNAKLPNYFNFTLVDYLKQFFLKNEQCFQIQVLVNGYLIFKLKDEGSVVNLGFVINKNNQLISYGSYVNNKLTGYGCKYENSTRYEGIFLNGFLNGEGLKFNAGKYSYGIFQNGTLTQAVYLQQRSLASQEKLQQLKKLQHITNLNYSNQYICPKLIKFKGTKQIIFELGLKQEYLFSQSSEKTSSGTKVYKNNLASKLLTSRQDIIQTKSNISIISNNTKKQKLNKNPQQDESRVIDIGKSISNANSVRRFNNNRM